ncbi:MULTISPECIES: hypothetical protein [unclassified Bradyrhizobium]|uniref:hypothetical protein n=1 Tax=unclassified Bradyrhizobium TaxID=2631580 RepID=UPI0024790DEB|nr:MULTISPECIES: hypothetical protein [unclassified Bradyrhizobium]WGS22892.1 hypothetical protein MTX22_15280 [Bradyrhizobium sp. ISRA463]WGS29888.1 hypothetical protein MTX19_13025 [Bradyrhizobium sp. ISRA464]
MIRDRRADDRHGAPASRIIVIARERSATAADRDWRDRAEDRVVPALVVGALIGVVSAGCYLFIVDQPITVADMAAVSDTKVGSLGVEAKWES